LDSGKTPSDQCSCWPPFERLQLGFGEPDVLVLGELVTAYQIVTFYSQFAHRAKVPVTYAIAAVRVQEMKGDVLVLDGWVNPNRAGN
jgi:hypothetical protein